MRLLIDRAIFREGTEGSEEVVEIVTGEKETHIHPALSYYEEGRLDELEETRCRTGC